MTYNSALHANTGGLPVAPVTQTMREEGEELKRGSLHVIAHARDTNTDVHTEAPSSV